MALFAEYSAPGAVVFTSPALSLRKNFLRELIMAGGWAKDGAVQDQIDASVEDAVLLARSRLPSGESRTHCEECNATIPEARRNAVPGVRLCITCQAAHDAEQGINSGYNRRGSKDSQLR
jgi:phage/conjugal plasmid C-4 type zinc finger TraR family protein